MEQGGTGRHKLSPRPRMWCFATKAIVQDLAAALAGPGVPIFDHQLEILWNRLLLFTLPNNFGKAATTSYGGHLYRQIGELHVIISFDVSFCNLSAACNLIC